jgi:hypothetical protein
VAWRTFVPRSRCLWLMRLLIVRGVSDVTEPTRDEAEVREWLAAVVTARAAPVGDVPGMVGDSIRRGRRRKVISAAAAGASLAVVVGVSLWLVPGLGSGNDRAPATGPAPTLSSLSPSPVSPLPTPDTTSASPQSASRPCAASDLKVTETGGDGAGGSAQAVLVFRNVGTVACWLRGYPTVAAEGSNQVLPATHTLDALWGGSAVVSTIPIAPGQAASATLQWGDNPGGNVTTCLSSPVLAVTPPGTTDVTRLQTPAFVSVCNGPWVLPVVAGTRGTVLAP